MKFKLLEIDEINHIQSDESDEMVYDLSVSDDESYTANGYIVHNCTTSANGGVHYPMASLVQECAELGKNYPKTKIVADGGFRNYSDVIKALALGADYVMLGGILNKCLESCGDNYNNQNELISVEEAEKQFKQDVSVYKEYRGMSTKEVQRKWGKINVTTAEGIVKRNQVEYTIGGWVENFKDYLKTNMSYCNKRSLEEYIGNVEYVFITQNAFNRFNK